MNDQAAVTAAPARAAVIYLRVSTKEQAERDGDPEGYSIPAQREACRRKAESLGANVLQEYVDRGESARSAARPELQRLLTDLGSADVDFVIVHKLDRLARNRADDVTITAEIVATGARLVSVTENIDETPSGHLLHGIMSSIAEFYSRNLAAEVVKGTQQKVRAGGTPNAAPIGYLNVRKLVDGYEVRTVELDPERSGLVRWAFEAYATGDWSLSQLTAELEVRGLTFRPTVKRPTRPITTTKLHGILRNRYYLGYVTWRGVEYDGKHPGLVDSETFETVQDTLTAHRKSGERASKHEHYLVGSLRCSRCGRRLLYTRSAGRGGRLYGYFYCASRLKGGPACGQRYLPASLVEQAVTRHWQGESVPEEDVSTLRDDLLADFDHHEAEVSAQLKALDQRIHKIKRDRFKWAEKAMDGVVPDDIARGKQQQLATQLTAVESQHKRLRLMGDLHRQALEAAFRLIANCGETYESAEDALRRAFNQTWFNWLEIDEDDDGIRVSSGERPEFGESIVTALHSRRSVDTVDRPVTNSDFRAIGHVHGSNVPVLVELRVPGFMR